MPEESPSPSAVSCNHLQHAKARDEAMGKPTADALLTKPPTRTSGNFYFCVFCRKKREPTSGLEPLTCSLRVCGQWLPRVARGCKSPLSKRFLVPSIARYCSALRAG